MDTPKQTVSVLFIFSIILFLCFSNNKFDLSSIILLLSDIYQLFNRRNMILLCHFILLFIVKDSGLLSPRSNELSVCKEKIIAPLEKEREFEVKEVRLESKEEIRESYIDRSLDIVVMENRKKVIKTNGEEELQEEKMESSIEEEWEDLSEEKAEHNAEEVWEVMQRRVVEEELEKECVGVIEQNGEDDVEKETVEELNKKIEEFIGKIKRQILSEINQPVLV